MSPSVSPDRPSNERRIQEQQTEINSLDGKADGKTDLANLSQEQRDALKQTYIEKVNAAQGAIRRSFEKIRTQKELRTEKWREWEAAVISIEWDLVRVLDTSIRTLKDPQAESKASEVVAMLNVNVDEYLAALDALKMQYDISSDHLPSLESPQNQSQSIGQIFTEWGVPGNKGEVQAKAKQAVSHYGEDGIRQLSAVISLYDALPVALRKKYFGTDAHVQRTQIAGQLANGTFEQSPLGVLLKENSATVDRAIAEGRERSIDQVAALMKNMEDLNERTRKQIVRLCGITKEDVASGTIADIVAWVQNTNGYPEVQARIVRSVQDLGSQVQTLKQEIDMLNAEVRVSDVALRTLDTAVAHQQGRAEEESQLLFLQKLESGIDVPLDSKQIAWLRPSQQELFRGRNTEAMRTSVRDFNQFSDAHPEFDTLGRTDVLQLTNVSQQEKKDATFTKSSGIGSDYGLLKPSFSRQQRSLEGFLANPEREASVLSRTGKLIGGGELIIIELQRPGSPRKEQALALRDAQGIVRLQNGTLVESPTELQPTTVGISHVDQRTLYLSPKMQQLLADQMGKDSRKRIVLRSELKTTDIASPITMGSFTTLDSSQIQIAEKDDDGMLRMYDADHRMESSLDAERLQKESIEKGGDVLQSIDSHPTIRDVTQRAGVMQENMQSMQTMLQTAMNSEANPGNEFIDQLRNYARPMLQTMEDGSTMKKVTESKAMLQEELKSIKLGKYVGEGVEREIRDRIDALDSYITVLSDNRLLNGLQTAMELRASTWESWMSKEGLIMLGAIIAAVIAIGVLTVFTGGAFLLTVPGILASSAVGGLAGMIGEQGTRELLYQYHNREGGGVQSGQYRYTDGSRVMNYARGQKIFDDQTGKFIEMDFLKDVASPYAQEFIISFLTTAAAMGVGGVAGKQLSKLAQNSKMIHALSKHSTICNSIMKYLSGLTNEVAASPTVRDFAKKSLAEILDELADEAKEGGVAQLLNRIDTRLGAMATFVVAATKGFKPLKGQRLSYGSDMTVDSVRAWAEGQGHTVVSIKAGVFDIKTFDGHTLIFEPERSISKSGAAVSTEENIDAPTVDLAKTNAPDVSLQIAPDNGNIIAARNAQNGSPEAAQKAADAFIQNRIEVAKRIASGEVSLEECIAFVGGRGAAEKLMSGVNEKLVEKGKVPYASVEAFVETEVRNNAKEFGAIIGRIDQGKIGGNKTDYFDNNFAIRELQKLVPGIDMEGKLAIAERLHQAAMRQNPDWLKHAEKTGVENTNEQEYYRWLTSTEGTMLHKDASRREIAGRPPLEAKAPNGEPVSLAENPSASKRLEGVIGKVTNFAEEGSSKNFSTAEAESVLNTVQNPLDRAVLAETTRLLAAIESKAGPRSLTDADRWKILEFSARYLQEFRAAKFPASPDRLMKIVTDNAVSLAHQQIADHQTLVGSSHGVLHVLRGNATMLQSLYDQLGFTPAQRVLTMQATFDHDVGYGKRTLAEQTEAQGVFKSSNDHPLESTLVVESNRAEYEAIFGRDGYTTIRNAILDHSDPLGSGQYQNDGGNIVSKLSLLTNLNADPAQRVAAAVALVDCLATVNNLKASPLFRDNPEVMAMMGRIGEIHSRKKAMKAEGKPAADIDALTKEATGIRLELQKRITQMGADGLIEKSEADAYVRSLESTMQIEESGKDFAINTNFGMLGASVSSTLRLENGQIHVCYTVDPRGQALIENISGSDYAKEKGASALIKAADDFGGLKKPDPKELKKADDSGALEKTDTEKLKEYVNVVRNSTKPENSIEGKEARAYLQATPTLILTTKGGLVMEFTAGQNEQYAEVANVVEKNIRINAIRDYAKQNLDKLLKDKSLTLPTADRKKQEVITDIETYVSRTEDAVRSLIRDLPGNYVVESSNGTHTPIKIEYTRVLEQVDTMQQQGATKEEIAQKWAEFCGRIHRSAGSEAPIAPPSQKPPPSQRAA